MRVDFEQPVSGCARYLSAAFGDRVTERATIAAFWALLTLAVFVLSRR
jgi:hypothetical protein